MEKVTHITKIKRGTVRQDGMVFWSMVKGREYWTTPSQFAKGVAAIKANRQARAHLNVEKNRAKTRAWYARNSQKACDSTKKWRENNPEKVKEQKTNWIKKPENRIRTLIGAAKQRAKKSGIEFSITMDDLLPLPIECPVLGIKINYNGNSDQRGFVDDSPSIDRIDSSAGYVKGNVKIICWRANRIKSDSTIEEMQAILNFMKREIKCK
jgi:hypothetical protein